jgi:hypothetical protein
MNEWSNVGMRWFSVDEMCRIMFASKDESQTFCPKIISKIKAIIWV